MRDKVISQRGEDTGRQDSLGAIVMIYLVVVTLLKRQLQLWLGLKARSNEPQTAVIQWMTMTRDTYMPDEIVLAIVPR